MKVTIDDGFVAYGFEIDLDDMSNAACSIRSTIDAVMSHVGAKHCECLGMVTKNPEYDPKRRGVLRRFLDLTQSN